MPQVAKFEHDTTNVKFLSVQAIHNMPMGMHPSSPPSKSLPSSGPKITAEQKRDSELTEKILKKSGRTLTYVLDQPSASSPLGKTVGEYGAGLGNWVLLSHERRVLASGFGPDTLGKSLHSL